MCSLRWIRSSKAAPRWLQCPASMIFSSISMRQSACCACICWPDPGVARMRSNAITLGDVAARFTLLEIACRRCERRGRLRLDQLIEQHGADMGLPELGDVLRGGGQRALQSVLPAAAAPLGANGEIAGRA